MSSPPNAVPPAPVAFEASTREKRPPQEKRRGLLRSVFEVGGPGVCYFAITNSCNARCGFCDFSMDKLPRSSWKFVERQGAMDAIEILSRNDIRYLIIFGGEPLLHPDVVSIVSKAREYGMTVLLITNGAKLREPMVRELIEAGVSQFIMSIDAATRELHEENRGLPGVCEKIRSANKLIKELGRQTIASVTMSRLLDYEAIPEFLESLGFDSVSFSYPITYLGSSFLGQSESELVSYTKEERHELFERVKRVKKRFRVTNPTASLEDMQRATRGESQRFECLGGYRYFHLDWNLDVWRCHYWHEPMCSIYDFDASQVIRDGCTACSIDCYRDSSVMQHVAMSMHDAYQAFAGGRPGEGLKALTRRTNAGSIGALLEEATSVLRYLGKTKR